MLKPDCIGISDPAQCFRTGQPAKLMKSVADSYDELTAQVKKHRPEAKIFVHQYDHAIPTGKGFMGMGQWLRLPMNQPQPAHKSICVTTAISSPNHAAIAALSSPKCSGLPAASRRMVRS